MLTRALLGEIRPVLAWRSLPMVLGGGTTIDFLPTMRPVYRYMKKLEKQDKVLDASMFNCHLWTKHDELGWSGVVMVDGDQALAERLADDLADKLWSVRHPQPPEMSTADEALAKIRSIRLRRRLGTVCVCDASSNSEDNCGEWTDGSSDTQISKYTLGASGTPKTVEWEEV